MDAEITGKVGISVPRSLVYLGTIYHSPYDAILELVDNSLDAEATRLYIELTPNRITVVDNGYGMVPDLLADDDQMMDLIEQDEEVHPPEDIKSMVSQISRRSLKWMMRFGALSAKSPVEGESVRGLRGIGAMSFRQIANKAVWISRAREDLARQYWGEAYKKGSIPTYELHPPTTEQLRKGELRYKIVLSQVPLRDVHNIELSSGTRVDLTDLKPEITSTIKPSVLVEHLRNRYDEDLRTHSVEIIIVERTTELGKRNPKGHEIIVTPATIQGIPVLNGTYTVRGGASFKAELYYNTHGKAGERPQIRRKTSNVAPLTNIPVLDRSPLNTGKISGFIQFPDVPEEVASWTADKHIPDTSPTQQSWIVKILDLIESEIEPAIAEIEQRNHSRELNTLATDAAKAMLDAMSRIDVFHDVDIQAPPTRPPVVPHPPALPTIAVGIQASVFNEHNRGVEDVQIVLLRNRSIIATKRTGKGGAISFGTVEPGIYTVRLGDIPENTVPRGVTEFNDFVITKDQPGFRAVFRLYTGSPAPDQRHIQSLDIIFRGFDPSIMYDASNLDKGTVQINTETDRWKRAMEKGDEEAKVEYIAVCAASAITEFSFPNEKPTFLLNQQCRLAVTAIDILKERRASRKKSTTARRKK